MNDEPDPLLLSVAEAVADGFDVDWAALRERAPHIVGDLTRMRFLAELGGAHRRVRERSGGTEYDIEHGDEPQERPC